MNAYACGGCSLDNCLPSADADKVASWSEKPNVVITAVLVLLVIVGVGLVGAKTSTEIGIALMVVGMVFLVFFFTVQVWRVGGDANARRRAAAERLIITGALVVVMCFAQLDNTDSVVAAVIIGFLLVFTGVGLLDFVNSPTRKLMLLVAAQALYVLGGILFPMGTAATTAWGVGFIVCGVLGMVSFLAVVWALSNESPRNMVLLATFTLGTTFVTSVVVLRTQPLLTVVLIPIIGIIVMLLSLRFMDSSSDYWNLCPCLPCLSR